MLTYSYKHAIYINCEHAVHAQHTLCPQEKKGGLRSLLPFRLPWEPEVPPDTATLLAEADAAVARYGNTAQQQLTALGRDVAALEAGKTPRKSRQEDADTKNTKTSYPAPEAWVGGSGSVELASHSVADAPSAEDWGSSTTEEAMSAMPARESDTEAGVLEAVVGRHIAEAAAAVVVAPAAPVGGVLTNEEVVERNNIPSDVAPVTTQARACCLAVYCNAFCHHQSITTCCICSGG